MGRRLGPKETPIRIEASERQAKAVALHTEGMTFRQIAKALGYAGPSGVKRAIDSAIRKAPSAALEELRCKSANLLECMLEELLPIFLDRKRPTEERLSAADRVLRIEESNRRLHGLDAPKRTEVTGRNGGAIAFDLSALTDEQLTRLASGDASPLEAAIVGGDPATDSGSSEDGSGEPG